MKIVCYSYKYSVLEREEWGTLCSNGTEQSPITLNKFEAIMAHYSEIKLSNYDKDIKADIQNNGHTRKHCDLRHFV